MNQTKNDYKRGIQDLLVDAILIVKRGTPEILRFWKDNALHYNEEDVTGYQKRLEIYGSGLGATLVIKGETKSLTIGIDDDNELFTKIE